VNYYVYTTVFTFEECRAEDARHADVIAGVERCHAVLDEKPDVSESPNALPITRAKGKIAFQNVSFEYTPGHPVLPRRFLSSCLRAIALEW